jgi:hypothetical protein
MPSKEPRQPKTTREQPQKIEKRDRQEIADDQLDSVSGGLSSTFGSTVSDASVCISQL